jgi:integral membrane protein
VLTRFRVMAYLTGVMLLVLCAGMINRYVFHGSPQLSLVISQIHGFLYIVYVGFTFDLGMKMGWKAKKMVLTLLAGTIPFCSFIAERRVVAEVTPKLAAQAVAASEAEQTAGA